jgi:hypothetical protein
MNGLSPPLLVPAICNTGIIAEQVWLQSRRRQPLILSNLATQRGVSESKATGFGPARRGRLGQKTDGAGVCRGTACRPLTALRSAGPKEGRASPTPTGCSGVACCPLTALKSAGPNEGRASPTPTDRSGDGLPSPDRTEVGRSERGQGKPYAYRSFGGGLPFPDRNEVGGSERG